MEPLSMPKRRFEILDTTCVREVQRFEDRILCWKIILNITTILSSQAFSCYSSSACSFNFIHLSSNFASISKASTFTWPKWGKLLLCFVLFPQFPSFSWNLFLFFPSSTLFQWLLSMKHGCPHCRLRSWVPPKKFQNSLKVNISIL